MGDEAVPLGGLSGGPATGHLECGEETIHMSGVVLDQLRGVVKLGAIINPHTPIQVASDDVMILDVLWEREGEHHSTVCQNRSRDLYHQCGLIM